MVRIHAGQISPGKEFVGTISCLPRFLLPRKLQAAEFYPAHLLADQRRKDSALVLILAEQWHESEQGGKTRQLCAATLKGIMESAETLKKSSRVSSARGSLI